MTHRQPRTLLALGMFDGSSSLSGHILIQANSGALLRRQPSFVPLAGAIDAPSKATLLDWLTRGFSSDLEKQTGLKMESGKAPVDYLFVDHMEKPSEN